MKAVYLIVYTDWDCSYVVRACATRELADKLIKEYDPDYHDIEMIQLEYE